MSETQCFGQLCCTFGRCMTRLQRPALSNHPWKHNISDHFSTVQRHSCHIVELANNDFQQLSCSCKKKSAHHDHINRVHKLPDSRCGTCWMHCLPCITERFPEDVSISSIASKTKNFSGAELEGLIRSATSYETWQQWPLLRGQLLSYHMKPRSMQTLWNSHESGP